MKVFVVTHNTRNGGRVRGVFSTEELAKKYIRPGKVKEFIKCDDCGQDKTNPEYDALEAWKSCLTIDKWIIDGEVV